MARFQQHIEAFNFGLLFKIWGILLMVMTAALVLPVGVSYFNNDGITLGLLYSQAIMMGLGLLSYFVGGRNARYQVKSRESFWITSMVWIMIPMIGSIPYLITNTLHGVIDAIFESFSGFTTTGSSVIANVDMCPKSILIWRSFTQWIGGLGILLFIVAIVKQLGDSSNQLYDAEFSGTVQKKLHPHMTTNVVRMWEVYILMTVLLGLLLTFCGNHWIDSLCLAMSTVSTGGFMPSNSGLTFLSNASLGWITLFMFFSGMNFALIYNFISGKWKMVWSDEEFRVYLLLCLGASLLCGICFFTNGMSFKHSFGLAIFHIASTISTCGFSVENGIWSLPVSAITFVLIFIGASAGSSGGGFKLKRMMILWKYVRNYFTKMIHPNAVTSVKIDKTIIPTDYINKIFAFVFMYLVIVLIGSFGLLFCGLDIPNATCMAAANMANLGPTPVNMGQMIDYVPLMPVAKGVIIVLMLCGRLEIFAIVALLMPSYWKKGM